MTQGSVQSVDRAITMLAAVCRVPGMSLTEVAATADLIPSTALRLLATLERHGLVERDQASRRYQIGAGMLQLAGVRNGAHEVIRERLESRLRALATVAGEQVAVGVLDNTKQLNIAVVDGAREAGEEVVLRSTGAEPQENLNATAVGKILLAYASPRNADELIRQLGFEQTAGHTITTPSRLRQHLKQVRQAGYATCVDENRPDVCGIAVPLHGENDEVVAALCINGPASRLPRNRLRQLLPALQQAAGACSTLLSRRMPQDLS